MRLTNVGPAPDLSLDLAPRLNLITGDNGVGKSFFLDVAWWALTRKWPYDMNPALTTGYPARPFDPKARASLDLRLRSGAKSASYVGEYARRDEAWVGRGGRPSGEALVIYAQAEGGFSVWDPVRNSWRTKGKVDVQRHLPGYVFSPCEVWDGLRLIVDHKPAVVSNGLLLNWSAWIRENGRLAKWMSAVLEQLSAEDEPLAPGPLTRLSVNDARDIPTIRTAYSDTVPIVQASSGIRRIASLAYILVWSWDEHLRAAAQLGEKPASQVILLFDEIENHLHPRWQQSILGSALRIAEPLRSSVTVQILAVTHSSLVMASAERLFDPTADAWFEVGVVPGQRRVVVEKRTSKLL